MAQSDINLIFSSAQAVTATAPSANYYDSAQGVMIATGGAFPAYNTLNLVWGQATYFGADLGIGTEKLPLAIYTGATAWTTGTSLNIQIQGAVDSGGTTYGGLTWNTYTESGTIVTSLLTANTGIWKEYWPHRKVAAAGTNGSLPRFYQLNYVVAGANFATAAIQFAGFLETRDDNAAIFQGAGFVVGA